MKVSFVVVGFFCGVQFSLTSLLMHTGAHTSMTAHSPYILGPSLGKVMDQGGGVLELHTQELKMPHAMIMQDFGRSRTMMRARYYILHCT